MSRYTPIKEGALATPALFNSRFDELSGGVFSFESQGILGSNTGAQNDAAVATMLEWLNDPNDEYYGQRVVLVGTPGQTYTFNSDVEITRGNVTVDLNWSIWSGLGRLFFNGDAGVDGDYSNFMGGCWMINGYIGSQAAPHLGVKGPRIEWCYESGAMNLTKVGAGGTAFNMYNCSQSWFINCRNTGSRLTGGASIGFLLHNCYSSGARDCAVIGAGRFGYGFQIKGGTDNKFIDCDVFGNLTNTFSGASAFYIRGDAPYKASATAGVNPPKTYPYADLGWGVADPRRESIDSHVINCRVWDCPTMNGVHMQEQSRTVIRNFYGRNIRNGIRCIRAPQAGVGYGHGADIDGVDVECLVRGIYVNGPTEADIVDDETQFGDGAFIEDVHIRNFRVVGGGVEEGILIKRCTSLRLSEGTATSASNNGISLRDSNTDAILSNVRGVSEAAQSGVLITNSNVRPRLVNVTGLNTSPSTVKVVNCAALPAVFDSCDPVRAASSGVTNGTLFTFTSALTTTAAPAVEGGSNVGDGTVEDIQSSFGSPTETFTLTATSSTSFSVVGSVSGSVGTATVDETFSATAIQFVILSGATAFVSGDTFTISVTATADDDLFRIEARVVGKETTGGGGYAEYHIKGLFRRVSESTVSQIGSTTTCSTEIETDSSWDGPEFVTNGAAVILRARAKTAVNVDWIATVHVELLT